MESEDIDILGNYLHATQSPKNSVTSSTKSKKHKKRSRNHHGEDNRSAAATENVLARVRIDPGPLVYQDEQQPQERKEMATSSTLSRDSGVSDEKPTYYTSQLVMDRDARISALEARIRGKDHQIANLKSQLGASSDVSQDTVEKLRKDHEQHRLVMIAKQHEFEDANAGLKQELESAKEKCSSFEQQVAHLKRLYEAAIRRSNDLEKTLGNHSQEQTAINRLNEDLSLRLSQSQNEIAAQKLQLASLAEELQAAYRTQSHPVLQSGAETMMETMRKQKDEIKELSQSRALLSNENMELQVKVEGLEAEMQLLQVEKGQDVLEAKQVERLRKEIDNLKQRQRSQDAHEKELLDALEKSELAREAAEEGQQHLQSQLHSVQKQLLDMEKELSAHTHHYEVKLEHAVQATVAEWQGNCAVLEERVQAAKNEQLDQKLVWEEERLQRDERIVALETELGEMHRVLRESDVQQTEAVERKDEKLRLRQKEMEQLQDQLRLLRVKEEESARAFEVERQGWRKQMDAGKEAQEGEKAEVAKQLEAASAELKQSMQLVCELEGELKEALTWRDQHDQSQARIVVLEGEKAALAQELAALQTVHEERSAEESAVLATTQRQLEKRETMVTDLQHQLRASEEQWQQQWKDRESAWKEERQRLQSQMQSTVAMEAEKVVKAVQAQQEVQEKLGKLQDAQEVAGEEAKAREDSLERQLVLLREEHSAQLQERHQQWTSLSQERDLLQQKAATLEGDLLRAGQVIATLQLENEQLAQGDELWRQRVEETQARHDAEVEKLHEELQAVYGQLQQMDEQLPNATALQEDLEKLIQELEALKAAAALQERELQTSIEQLQSDIGKRDELLEKSSDEVTQLQTMLHQQEEASSLLANKCSLWEEKARILEKRQSAESETAAALKAELQLAQECLAEERQRAAARERELSVALTTAESALVREKEQRESREQQLSVQSAAELQSLRARDMSLQQDLEGRLKATQNSVILLEEQLQERSEAYDSAVAVAGREKERLEAQVQKLQEEQASLQTQLHSSFQAREASMVAHAQVVEAEKEAVLQLRQTQSELLSTQSRIVVVERQLEEKSAELLGMSQSVESGRAERSALQSQLTAAQVQLAGAKKEMDLCVEHHKLELQRSVQNAVSPWKETVSGLEQLLEAAKKEQHQLQSNWDAERQQSEKNLAEGQKEMETLRQTLQTQQQASTQALERKEDALRRSQEELEQLQTKLLSLNADMQQWRDHIQRGSQVSHQVLEAVVGDEGHARRPVDDGGGVRVQEYEEKVTKEKEKENGHGQGQGQHHVVWNSQSLSQTPAADEKHQQRSESTPFRTPEESIAMTARKLAELRESVAKTLASSPAPVHIQPPASFRLHHSMHSMNSMSTNSTSTQRSAAEHHPSHSQDWSAHGQHRGPVIVHLPKLDTPSPNPLFLTPEMRRKYIS